MAFTLYWTSTGACHPSGGLGPSPLCSPATFSGFSAEAGEVKAISLPTAPADSALIQGTKAFGPPDMVTADIDRSVAEMVNFLFDYGLREEGCKAICEDEIVKRLITAMLLHQWTATCRCWWPLSWTPGKLTST